MAKISMNKPSPRPVPIPRKKQEALVPVPSRLLEVADTLVIALQKEQEGYKRSMYVTQGRIQGILELLREYHKEQEKR